MPMRLASRRRDSGPGNRCGRRSRCIPTPDGLIPHRTMRDSSSGTLLFAVNDLLSVFRRRGDRRRKLPSWVSREVEEVAAEFAGSVSKDAIAVEYLRDGRREFFISENEQHIRKPGATPRGSTDYSSTAAPSTGKQMTVREVEVRKRTWAQRHIHKFLRYFLPAGFPASVGPGYMEYTRWRLSAFFWGGAVGVFSTQGLLVAVGVGRQSAAPMAASLQWVIRDGIGRVGRMFFSQVGTGFDAETKQFRLAAAAVLNVACALESATRAVPQLFLPVACLANMAKGASTVAAASTRGTIYRSFMRGENLGDITAKQETVGVAGDLMGTCLGIALSRLTHNSRQFTTVVFAFVSFMHLYSSYREVKGLHFSTLNRQRAHMLIKDYLLTRTVPSVAKVNANERVLNRPWLDSLHAPNIDLGARLRDCAPDAEALNYLLYLYRREKYILTYEDTRLKIVLRSDAKSHDCLKAFLQADEFWHHYKNGGIREDRNRALLEQSYSSANDMFPKFVSEAEEKGWGTSSVLLRPIGRRVAWGAALTK